MKYYVTKYALTNGIISVDGRTDMIGDYVHVVSEKGYLSYSFKIGVDAFKTYEEAHIKAVSMRDRKIESLKKQLLRLEKLRFDSPTEEDNDGDN